MAWAKTKNWSLKDVFADFESKIFQIARRLGKVPMVWQGVLDSGAMPGPVSEPVSATDGGSSSSSSTPSASDWDTAAVVEPWKCWSGLAVRAGANAALTGNRVIMASCWYIDYDQDWTSYLSSNPIADAISVAAATERAANLRRANLERDKKKEKLVVGLRVGGRATSTLANDDDNDNSNSNPQHGVVDNSSSEDSGSDKNGKNVVRYHRRRRNETNFIKDITFHGESLFSYSAKELRSLNGPHNDRAEPLRRRLQEFSRENYFMGGLCWCVGVLCGSGSGSGSGGDSGGSGVGDMSLFEYVCQRIYTFIRALTADSCILCGWLCLLCLVMVMSGYCYCYVIVMLLLQGLVPCGTNVSITQIWSVECGLVLVLLLRDCGESNHGKHHLQLTRLQPTLKTAPAPIVILSQSLNKHQCTICQCSMR